MIAIWTLSRLGLCRDSDSANVALWPPFNYTRCVDPLIKFLTPYTKTGVLGTGSYGLHFSTLEFRTYDSLCKYLDRSPGMNRALLYSLMFEAEEWYRR